MMGAFCEGMSLADQAGLPQEALLEVLGLGAMVRRRQSLEKEGLKPVNFQLSSYFPLSPSLAACILHGAV